MDHKAKKLLSGTIIYGIGNFGTKIISFLLVPLYTYYISTVDMGDYDIVITTVSLLTPIITLRISDAAYRWMLKRIENIPEYICATYRVLCISTIISFVVILSINAVVEIKYSYYFIGLLIFGRWHESIQTLLRGLQKRKLYAIAGIVYTLLYSVINLYRIVIQHAGIEALFQSAIISHIIVIIFILLCTPELRVNIFRRKNNIPLIKEMLRYSGPLVPSGLSWWVMDASDRYVIRAFLGAASNGIYAIAYKFPSIISVVFTLFSNSWTDLLLSEIKEGKETSDYSSLVFEKVYMFSFSLVIAIIPFTKLACNFILSEAYKDSSSYISFLYLGAIFQGFTSIITTIFLQKGNANFLVAKSSIIGAVANILIDLLAIHYIGLYAASISTFCGFFLMWVLRVKDLKTINPIRINKTKFSLMLAVSIIFSFAVIYSTMILDIILSIIGLGVFLSCSLKYIRKYFASKLSERNKERI